MAEIAIIDTEKLGLPDKFRDFREYQEGAIRSCLASTKKVFILSAPTGSGKSLIGYACHKASRLRTIYLASTKQLQEQVARDFPDMVVLKGRNNYRCELYPREFPQRTAEDCIKDIKISGLISELQAPAKDGEDRKDKARIIEEIDDIKEACNNCDYLNLKIRAIKAPICCLNYSYFLNEANYIGAFSGAPLIIADECDLLEKELMSFSSIIFTDRELEKIGKKGWGEPEHRTKPLSWQGWVEKACAKAILEGQALEILLNSNEKNLELLKEYTWLKRKINKFQFFLSNFDEKSWVWYLDGKERWEFKPVWVSRFGQANFWKHTAKVLAMSAYVYPAQFARNTGLKGEEMEFRSFPSTFPRERRPIYYMPVADMKKDTKEEEWPKMVDFLKDFLPRLGNKKTLIHCASYDLANFVYKGCDNGRMIIHGRGDRYEKLEDFKKEKVRTILLSPSMERGIDLPGELCVYCFFLKVPYPNLGDPQVAKRLYASKDGQEWYSSTTVANLVQGSGRGVRSREDRCEIYILDKQFERLYNENKKMFPQWWREALHFKREI